MFKDSKSFEYFSHEESQKRCKPRRLICIFAVITILISMSAVITWLCTGNSSTTLKKDEYKNDPMCKEVPNIEKYDCNPDAPVTEEKCLSRGCCYALPNNKSNDALSIQDIPYCFYPPNYSGYILSNVSVDGKRIRAKLTRNYPSGFQKDIKSLNLVVSNLDDSTIRIKITDADSTRFEVPLPLHFQTKPLKNPLYHVELNSTTGILMVLRKSSGAIVFNTDLSRLVYSDQFLQLSSALSSNYFYGIGEHYAPLLRSINWTKFTLMNSDLGPIPNHSLYGSHPFYMVLESDGKANGAFLLNSNAMDVVLQPTPAVTFRPIGGILDIFIMLGESPENVVQQYTGIIGRTFMPPYWSLGFQLCRWGYDSLNKTREAMQRTLDASIPLDVQWNDIDYMEDYKDFTYDKVNFQGLPEFVDELHSKGLHYVLMIDPGISNLQKSGTYPPYEEGIDDDIFIKNADGSILEGKVWSAGTQVYPDFSHPASVSYWTRQLQSLHDEISYDGVWIDMNEPSNFVNGAVNGCPESSFENPPYLPGGVPLTTKTACMTAKHFHSIHYNEHNLYAYREAVATNQALRTVRKKRPFIISRASFAGQGVQSGHWSGDIQSTWNDMRYTIPSLLNFNLYGMPMVGSDICGFGLNTTVELCARWQVLGAFYPFSRNHNEKATIEQDPVALGQTVVEAAKNSLQIRYALLPYLYTLFYRSHVFGDTVARPLFFEYPNDVNTYAIDQQFLWGSAVMIVPALYPNVTSVEAYFPAGVWYDKFRNKIISKGQMENVPANITDVNIFMRGGSILPLQALALTTTESRKMPFVISAALNEKTEAFGELYWDDGDSLNTFENENYNLINFSVKSNTLQSAVVKKGYETTMKLGIIQVIGFSATPKTVSVNGVECSNVNYLLEEKEKSNQIGWFNSDGIFNEVQNNSCIFGFLHNYMVIETSNLNVSLLSPFSATWN